MPTFQVSFWATVVKKGNMAASSSRNLFFMGEHIVYKPQTNTKYIIAIVYR